MAHNGPKVTRWEVEDFIEEVQTRPTMWFGKGLLWVRRKEGENHVAIKFLNGLPDDMYQMQVHALIPSVTQEEAERYAMWLLEKFTTYGHRMHVEDYLQERLCGWDEGNYEIISEIARRVCDPDFGVVENIVSSTPPSISPTEAMSEKEPTTVEQPKVERQLSSYLRKLLGQR